MNSRRLVVVLVVAAVVVLVAVGTASFVYALFLAGDNVPALGLDTPAPSASSAAAAPSGATAVPGTPAPESSTVPGSTAPGNLAGTWKVASGVAGYRVRETFLQQNADSDAVGRTSGVSGTVAVTGTPGSLALAAASIQVDLTGLSSDRDRRDQALQGRGLEIGAFPTTTFEVSGPVTLPASFGSTDVSVTLPGKLALHGVTKDVQIAAQARVEADGTVVVAGTLPIVFADYGIEAPNVAGVIAVQDHGSMEFRVVLSRG
jgi:polyisoprenoid-binding protein YceI